MRIAFVIRSLGIGGAERQLAVLATGLAARGHTVLVVIYYGGGARHQELEAVGVPVATLGKRGRWDLLGPLVGLWRAIRGFQPEVVHGYLPDGNLLALLAGRLMRRAVVVWGVRSSEYDFQIYDWLFSLLFRMSCWLAHGADLIIANSEAGRTYHVAKGYPADRTVVIPNGVDTGWFRPDPVRRERQRREWGLERSQPLIGMVGRLDPMKGHPTFLRAAGMLARRIPAVRFVCIGDGPPAYRLSLEACADAEGVADRVRWIPAAEDLVAAYNALDMLVSVSTSGEGFPNVIGEAMACGVRCAVTEVGDSVRVIGDTGVVLPKGEPAAIADALCVALPGLGDSGQPDPRQRIEAEYSVAKLLTRTEERLGRALRRAAW